MIDRITSPKPIGRPKGGISKHFDQARESILQASLENFAAKGFAGASISQIAKSAGIHQSLIYHYFENKKELWQAVKTYLIEENKSSYLDMDENLSVDKLIEGYITSRFNFYREQPLVLRMTLWQRLEDNPGELSHPKAHYTGTFYDILVKKQKQGCINKDIDLNWFVIMLAESVLAPLLSGGG